MKKLLNTLYVLTPDSYIYTRNDNICVKIGGDEKVSVPAITLDGIVCFGVMTVSTPLLQFCGKNNISITFLSEYGKYYGKFCGEVTGNILLRKKQFDSLNDDIFTTRIVRTILMAKFRNSRFVLSKFARSEKRLFAAEKLNRTSEQIANLALELEKCDNVDSMRGIEGAAASLYFDCFDLMLSDKCKFKFEERSRRPPRNEVNAVLSFVYTILAREVQSAMETVGLDPAAGYLHVLRPGRASLALDLIEELRAPLCDRFVISLFNRGQINEKDFEYDSQAVMLNDRGRKTVLNSWQMRKKEEIRHPFLDEKIPIGMIPFGQAMLFARVLRGDLDYYPPFAWR